MGGGVRELTPSANRRPWIQAIRRVTELASHLALRELASRHRFTALGWAWPLTRQLAQLGVLLVVFTSILNLGIDNYALFLFVGLIAWTWFSAAVSAGTNAVTANGHLLRQPRCPAAALPLAPVLTALVDVLIAIPVLLAMVIASETLDPAVVAIPLIAAIQLLLTAGIVWFTSASAVYFRDIPQLVIVVLLLAFYLTPVFYDVARVPPEYQDVLELNPLAVLIEAYRDVLIDGRLPEFAPLAILTAFSAAVAAAGLATFNRLRPGFVDEL